MRSHKTNKGYKIITIFTIVVVLVTAASCQSTKINYTKMPITSNYTDISKNKKELIRNTYQHKFITLTFIKNDSLNPEKQNKIFDYVIFVLQNRRFLVIKDTYYQNKTWYFYHNFNNNLNAPVNIDKLNTNKSYEGKNGLKISGHLFISFFNNQGDPALALDSNSIRLNVNYYDANLQKQYGNIITINEEDDLKLFQEKMQSTIETLFPITSIVLEVRGENKALLISAGRSKGVVKGQKFAASKNLENYENMANNQQIKLIIDHVLEDSSWGYLQESYLETIDVGTVMQSVSNFMKNE